MAANLRDRLNRIRELKKSESVQETRNTRPPCADVSALTEKGWEECGFQVLKRDVIFDAPFKTRKKLPPALAVVVPDLAGRSLPVLEDFLFFDLETTGLSGGAGTVAFLAAFGRIAAGKLRITQYLLLDYPGENDFLAAVLKEFENEQSVIVTYNGKCFDSQILKTRCLMNGIRPPEYYHADLLHPARRLWKTVIFDCSQASVETRILGLDRSGDTPGALAPVIWFDFLKTGRTEQLEGICDHNCADIAGLSSMLAAMISIASEPLDAKYRYDVERLSLHWRDFLRRTEKIEDGDLQITGEKLLRFAADENFPRAAFVYAALILRGGNHKEGRKRLRKIAESDFPENIKAAALRTLAIDSERRLKCFEEALEFVNMGLEIENSGAVWRSGFERQKERLQKKLNQSIHS
jgi:uncharacterized protein YprB with RNaseH-like and TPR domain